MKQIIEKDRKILKENGFEYITVYSDGSIRLPKTALCLGLGKKLKDLGIKSKIKAW